MWTADLQPKLFGWFHISGILLAIAAGYGGVLLGRKLKDNKKGVSVCLWIAEISLIVLEAVKEIFYAVENGGYRWDMFPMQICSIIVFVLPIVMLVNVIYGYS